jgi:hypothetical protein
MRLIFIFLIIFPLAVSAQLTPACAGGSTAVDCASACINCNFNGYVGSTAGYPSGIVPHFCGTVENAQWMGFIAGTNHIVFTVTPSNCSDGNGVQVALYEDCMGEPLGCKMGEFGGGNLALSLDVQVTPGRNYFLMIDGFAGDQCDFSVSVSPNDAVYEPPLGAVGNITGPAKVCPGATMRYQVPPVFGASAYTWSGPAGTRIDTLALPVTLVGQDANYANITFGNIGGPICVQAANSCNQTPDCSTPFMVEILDDSYRPSLAADTTAHLTCTGEPATLQVFVPYNDDFTFQWTTDSSGHIVSGQNHPNVMVDQTGNYSLLVTNAQNGCTSTLVIQVSEPDTPRTADLRLKNITCYGFDDGIIKIGEVQGGLPPYSYSLDGQNFCLTPEFRNLKPGVYNFSIETADACRWDTLINLLEPEVFTLDLGDDVEIHLGDSLELWQELNLSDPDRAASIAVVPPDLNQKLCDGCMVQPLHSFRYTIVAIDSNGCIASDDRIVSVSKERHVFVPNIFAPDSHSDGNERFTVYGGSDVLEVEWFRVLDRWGKVVYENPQGFAPNQPNTGWDGIVGGEKSAPGVFVWQASIRYIDGEKETLSGNVTLLR